MRDNRVFWIKRLKKPSATELTPNNKVVDLLSGLPLLSQKSAVTGRNNGSLARVWQG